VAEPFPKFPIPEGHSADSFFEYVARQGFEKRRVRLEALAAQGHLKHDLAEYTERLDREIDEAESDADLGRLDARRRPRDLLRRRQRHHPGAVLPQHAGPPGRNERFR
jgi:hypothetical protein